MSENQLSNGYALSITHNVLPLAVSGGLKKTDFRLTTNFNKMQETNNLPQTPPLQQTAVSGSCYRIITDKYAGYEVQIRKRFLFWKWWEQCHSSGCVNTHLSIEDAKKWIEEGCPKKKPFDVVWVSGNCR